MNRTSIKERCAQFEAKRRRPYWDCCSLDLRAICPKTKTLSHPGKLTWGIGRNIEDRPASTPLIEFMLDEDADAVETELKQHLPWVYDLSENRQLVFFDLLFNMGWPTFSQFKNFLKHAKAGDWDIAATHLLLSKYATDVGKRARINAQMLRDG